VEDGPGPDLSSKGDYAPNRWSALDLDATIDQLALGHALAVPFRPRVEQP
jgi:hypothetical protein